jgi:cytochrome c556
MPMSLVRPTRLALSVLIASAVFASTAMADGPPASKGEAAVHYRKSVYEVLAWNFAPMGAMAQGKAPYNAAEFTRRADRVAALAPLLTEAFPPESQAVKKTDLKADAWSNRADFDAKLKDLIDRSAALATVAKGGDFEKSKAAFFDTANTCKACHDKYKVKD